jgi:hypothetical protein
MEVSMKKLIVFLVVVLTAFSMFSINIVKDGKNVEESKTFEGPYMFFGDKLDFKGKAADIFGFAGIMNVSGDIGSDFIGFGKSLNLSGNIGHNVIAGGTAIQVDKTIGGTVFLAAESLNFGKDSVINGALFMGAGDINLNGKVNGDIYAGSRRLNIYGEVNGNIIAYSGKIVISENGKINGNIEYHSEYEMSKSDIAKVTGKVKFVKEKNKFFNEHGNKEKMKKTMNAIAMGIRLLFMINFLIVGLLLLLFPGMKKLEEERTRKNFWYDSLFGLIPLFIYPTSLLFMLLFVITIPAMFAFLFAIIPLVMVTQIIGVTMIGQFLFGIFKWNKPNRFLYFLFGFAFFLVLGSIPFIGFLIGLLAASLGCGFFIEMLFRKKLGEN